LGTLFSFQNSRDPSQNPIDCVLLALASILVLLFKTKTFNSGVLRGWSTDAWLHAEITAVNCRALERQSSLARPILYTLTKSSQFALFFSRSPAGKPSSNHNPVGYSKQTGHSYFHHPGSGGTGSFPSNGFPDGPRNGNLGKCRQRQNEAYLIPYWTALSPSTYRDDHDGEARIILPFLLYY